MTNIGPTLETNRLILRMPSKEDLPAFTKFCADAETTRFIGGVSHPSMAWRAWAAMIGGWHLNGFGYFSMIEKSTGQWIGRTGPWQPPQWPGTEIGWGIMRDAAGKGYAREAAIACIDWAIDILGWDDVIHTIDPENHASIALAERLGSKPRGPVIMPPPFHEKHIEIWGQTKAEWLVNKRAFT
ncbi:GNAT family N-acetyltransferase [Sphingorhabdus lutea]|uniref:GNAT family N-acetyltransferase n=1 Tax=Sphingorhabdus lutea TaxID=1913578 RepID=A0A1L3JE41_9SPHN|nr:GNAT family N-acetyltransferase [Sphingorhabdus lutea]APG63394.1 GNAT family N-acetyltransferase [Sphingorhabdus lutea]